MTDTLPMPIAIPTAVMLWILYVVIRWTERRRDRVAASQGPAVVHAQSEAAGADRAAAAAAVRAVWPARVPGAELARRTPTRRIPWWPARSVKRGAGALEVQPIGRREARRSEDERPPKTDPTA